MGHSTCAANDPSGPLLEKRGHLPKLRLGRKRITWTVL
jgi:hypothetical protein